MPKRGLNPSTLHKPVKMTRRVKQTRDKPNGWTESVYTCGYCGRVAWVRVTNHKPYCDGQKIRKILPKEGR